MVVLISATLAMVRGFVREVLSIASWVAAAGAAYLLYKPIVPLVRPYIESGTVATIIAAVAVFFVALILASYLTTKISDFVIDSRVGAIDRVAGFLFGAARGVVLVAIALKFFNWLVPVPPTWVADARTAPMLNELTEQIIAVLPEDIEGTIRGISGGNDGGTTAGTTGDSAAPPAPDDEDGVGADDPDYGTTTRQNLDQLIQSSDN